MAADDVARDGSHVDVEDLGARTTNSYGLDDDFEFKLDLWAELHNLLVCKRQDEDVGWVANKRAHNLVDGPSLTSTEPMPKIQTARPRS